MVEDITKGICSFCSDTFAKASIAEHLDSCLKRKARFKKLQATQKSRLQNRTFFHLLVEGQELPEYWLHLQAPSHARLGDLDSFLRLIWLECCGHLSAFTIEDQRYSVRPMEEFDEQDLDIMLGKVLSPGMDFDYEYDYGSTTYLTLKVLAEEQNTLKGKLIQLLARNEAPAMECSECGKMATQICAICQWSEEAWYCDECFKYHACGEDMFLPIVNSPRTGVCGYTG